MSENPYTKNFESLKRQLNEGRLRIATVNNAIKKRGIKAELVQGEVYFYFIGRDVEGAHTASVMTFRLNDLSLDQWMVELNRVLEEARG